jgi:hypothetical protein
LNDGGTNRYHAIHFEILDQVIGPELIGCDASNQIDVDKNLALFGVELIDHVREFRQFEIEQDTVRMASLQEAGQGLVIGNRRYDALVRRGHMNHILAFIITENRMGSFGFFFAFYPVCANWTKKETIWR